MNAQKRTIYRKIWQRVQDRVSRNVNLDGVKILLDRGALTHDEVKSLVRHHYERDERKIVSQSIDRDDLVLEIGAGIGLISALCAIHCGQESVVAYEANPQLIEQIRNNHRANGLTNVDIRNFAVVPDDFEEPNCDFYIGDKFWMCSLYPQDGWQKVSVPARRLTDALSEQSFSYLIMDVEGAEYALLPSLLACPSLKKVCIETHPQNNPNCVDIKAVMSDLGFTWDRNSSIRRNLLFRRN